MLVIWGFYFTYRKLRSQFSFLCSPSLPATPTTHLRAQKEAEATNGCAGGDTPPEDEVGGADDEILVDGEAEIRDEDSPEDSLGPGKGPSPPTTKSDDIKELCESVTRSTLGGVAVAAAVSSRVAKTAESASSSRGRGEPGERSAKSSVESAPDVQLTAPPPPLPSLSSTSGSSHSQRDHAPSNPVPERQPRRLKVKDRGDKNADSASLARGAGRQGTSSAGGGRSRVHGSRSSGGESQSSQISAISSVASSASSSSSISRLSPMTATPTVVTTPTSSPRTAGRKEDGWKEVGRR